MNRQQQKDETRKKLISTALGVFSEKGILNTRMSDIALAAGVSHGTVFVHFETQDALISAVIDSFGLTMAGRVHILAAPTGSLREVLSTHLEGIAEHEIFYSRLVDESVHLPPAGRNALIGIQSAVSYHISQSALREMNAGLIKTMPVALLFNIWVGLVHYYLSNGDLFAPGQSVIQTCGPMLVDHFMNLLVKS